MEFMYVLKYGEQGTLVSRTQQALVDARYDPGKVDGILGPKTWRALQQLAVDNEMQLADAGPGVGPIEVHSELLELLLNSDEACPTDEGCTIQCGEYKVIDLRDVRVPSRPKVRMVRGKPALSKKDTICLHQTAVEFGVGPNQLRQAGGDRGKALVRRSHNVACHVIGFTPDPAGSHGPLLVAASPFDWVVNHGNGLNDRSLGIEYSCAMAGIQDDLSTLWCPGGRGTCSPTSLSTDTLDAWRFLLAWTYEKARSEGHRIKYLAAHRQSSATRRSDPGELLWREIALWAEKELGLIIERNRVWGTGRVIPNAWDPKGKGRY